MSEAPPRTRMIPSSPPNWSRGARRAAVPLGLLALWQILASTGRIDTRFCASPLEVVQALRDLITTGDLGHHLAVSLRRAALGLSIGALGGLAFGAATGLSRLGEDLFDPTLQAVRTLPLLGLIPLFILWFGLGDAPRLLLIALGTFFPVYINVFRGIRGIDARLVELAASYRLGRIGLVREVILPGALAPALVGLRQSIGIAWLCLVVAEQVNASAGLGYIIIQANALAQTSVIITALVIYALLGLGTDSLVRLIERFALRWQNVFEGT